MMILRGLILTCLLLAPLTAQATSCRDQWASVNDLLVKIGTLEEGLPGLVREGVNGTCRINGVNFPTRGERVTINTKAITWTAAGMDRFVTEGLPPTSLDLRIEGISVRPDFGDKALSYLNEVQNRGHAIDLMLVAGWNEESRAFAIEALNLEFPQQDHIRISAELDGIDLSTRGAMQMSAGSAVLRRFSVDVRSERMFQDYFLQPLGMSVLVGSEDPEARVETLKETAKAFVGSVPQDILPNGSKDAFVQLLDGLPELSGRLVLSAAADPGLGAARFLPVAMTGGAASLDQIWAALSGLRIDATYEPF